jgi:hypothetical protein
MAAGDTARLYHALSSYSPGRWDPVTDRIEPIDDPRVLRDFVTNDIPFFPAPCKMYPRGLEVVELPRSWSPRAGSTLGVLAGQSVGPAARLDLERLARLLHLTAGILRTAVRRDGRRFLLRAATSAGGLCPIELYVAARGVDGLGDGVHWFDPRHHALLRIGPPPGGDATTVVLTGIPWRTAWRYAERALRHMYWDVGTMLAQAIAVAEDEGLSPRLRTTFPDDVVSRLVGADGVQEYPLAILTVGDDAPAIQPGGDASAGIIDWEPVEFPLVSQAQHAGDGTALGAPWQPGPPLAVELPQSDGLDDVIRRRASPRTIDASRSVTRDAFELSMAASVRGSRVSHFVAAHGVDGVAPGLYRWPTLAEPMRSGALRDEMYSVCYEQELGRDAAFVAIGAVDLAGTTDRGYREAQLDSGMVSGRLQLATDALGFGASGMSLLDSELPGLLGEPLAGLELTCAGYPTRRPWRGGTPGAPVALPPPAPRSS